MAMGGLALEMIKPLVPVKGSCHDTFDRAAD
jgi:hypothetical protein